MAISSKSKPKTSAKTSGVELMPQEHGGALQRGNPGNSGGGRPKEIVREKLARLAEGKGVTFLESLLDGKVKVQLVGKCPHCEKESPAPDHFVNELMDKIQTSVDHRLKANEQALKYGVGTKDELSINDDPRVQQFIQTLMGIVQSNVGTQVYESIAEQLTQALEKTRAA